MINQTTNLLQVVTSHKKVLQNDAQKNGRLIVITLNKEECLKINDYCCLFFAKIAAWWQKQCSNESSIIGYHYFDGAIGENFYLKMQKRDGCICKAINLEFSKFLSSQIDDSEINAMEQEGELFEQTKKALETLSRYCDGEKREHSRKASFRSDMFQLHLNNILFYHLNKADRSAKAHFFELNRVRKAMYDFRQEIVCNKEKSMCIAYRFYLIGNCKFISQEIFDKELAWISDQ
jgi:hypothetical protein